MKRKITIFPLMIFIVFCFSGISSAQGIFKGFSLKLSGGLGTMSIGDLNELFESNEAFLNAILAMELPEEFTYTRSGEYPKLNTGLDLEGAFIAHLTDNFGVGIEFGYMQRTTEGDVTLSLSIEGEDLSVNWKYKPKLNVYPRSVSKGD